MCKTRCRLQWKIICMSWRERAVDLSFDEIDMILEKCLDIARRRYVRMIKNGQPGGGFLLKHGSLEVPFKIAFSDRRQLTIHVHPELRLEVLAPIGRRSRALSCNACRRTERMDRKAVALFRAIPTELPSTEIRQWRDASVSRPTVPLESDKSGLSRLSNSRKDFFQVQSHRQRKIVDAIAMSCDGLVSRSRLAAVSDSDGSLSWRTCKSLKLSTELQSCPSAR